MNNSPIDRISGAPRIGFQSGTNSEYEGHTVRHTHRCLAIQLAPELWFRVMRDLPRAADVVRLGGTCKEMLFRTNVVRARLLQLMKVRSMVCDELRRLCRPETRTRPTSLTSQQQQQIADAFAAHFEADHAHLREDALQPGFRQALHDWGSQILGYAWGLHRRVARIGPAAALPIMLQQASHLPKSLLRMAVPRLAETAVAATPGTPHTIARFVDHLFTLDDSLQGQHTLTASNLEGYVDSRVADSDEHIQALLQTFMDQCQQRPPDFEAAGLAWLCLMIPRVGVSEDTPNPGNLPPVQRRSELFQAIHDRLQGLPDRLAAPVRTRLMQQLDALPLIAQAQWSQIYSQQQQQAINP